VIGRTRRQDLRPTDEHRSGQERAGPFAQLLVAETFSAKSARPLDWTD